MVDEFNFEPRPHAVVSVAAAQIGTVNSVVFLIVNRRMKFLRQENEFSGRFDRLTEVFEAGLDANGKTSLRIGERRSDTEEPSLVQLFAVDSVALSFKQHCVVDRYGLFTRVRYFKVVLSIYLALKDDVSKIVSGPGVVIQRSESIARSRKIHARRREKAGFEGHCPKGG